MSQTDEKIYHVLGLKELTLLKRSYFKATYRFNPYQDTNGIFHRTRTNNFKICIETQKTPNSKNNLRKEKQSRRNHAP